MQRLVQIAKIFSDINRVRMIALMHRDKELCVCEFCDTLELSQPLVSRHLKQMREAGVVTSKKNGKWMLYSLLPHPYMECFLEIINQEEHSLPEIIICNTKHY